MYCGKCGKEIKDKDRFCSYCGAVHVKQINVSDLKLSNRNNEIKLVFNIVPLILVSILVFLFYKYGISNLDKNMDAFDWVSNSAKTIGIIVYWGIPIIFSSLCIEYIMKCITEKMNVKMLVCIKASIKMFFYGIILWLGSTIYSDWTNDDMSIVFYRIFSTYEELIGITMIFAFVILVCGILREKIN